MFKVGDIVIGTDRNSGWTNKTAKVLEHIGETLELELLCDSIVYKKGNVVNSNYLNWKILKFPTMKSAIKQLFR